MSDPKNDTDFAVAGCLGCPFAHFEAREYWDECTHPKAPDAPLPGDGLSEDNEAGPPDWCPLRSGSVTVRLGVKP